MIWDGWNSRSSMLVFSVTCFLLVINDFSLSLKDQIVLQFISSCVFGIYKTK